jgi:hypothetical protein
MLEIKITGKFKPSTSADTANSASFSGIVLRDIAEKSEMLVNRICLKWSGRGISSFSLLSANFHP